MKKLQKPLFAFVLVLVILFVALALFRHSHKSSKISPTPTIVKKSTEILLSFAGDCTFGSVNGDGSGMRFPAVYERSHRLDYPFELVRPWFVKDDLTIVNFGCTLTNSAQTADKQWKFKGDARYAAIFPPGRWKWLDSRTITPLIIFSGGLTIR